MTISKNDKVEAYLGCVPLLSTYTGSVKIQGNLKNYKICQQAQNHQELNKLKGPVAERFKHIENYQERKLKLCKAYKIERFFNLVETIPLIGNIIILFRNIHLTRMKAASPKNLIKQEEIKRSAEQPSSEAPVDQTLVNHEIDPPIKEKLNLNSASSSSEESSQTDEESSALCFLNNELNAPNTIHYFKVLDQRGPRRGEEHCGFHAFKNALAAVSMLTGQPHAKDLFTDPVFYKTVKQFMDEVEEGNKGDASIEQLMSSYEYLINNQARNYQNFVHGTDDRVNIPNILQPYSSLLQMPGVFLSMVNVDEGQISGSAGGAASLNSLANLIQFSTSPTPKAHIFLVGNEGHWTTLMLQVNDENQMTWVGCDSYGNRSQPIRDNVQLLTRFLEDLQDPTVQKNFLKESYSAAIGKEIANFTRFVDQDGRLMDPSRDAILKSSEEYLKLLYRGYLFMQRMDLFKENSPFKEEATDLKKFALYFSKKLKNSISYDQNLSDMVEVLFGNQMQASIYPEYVPEPFMLTSEMVEIHLGPITDQTYFADPVQINFYHSRDSEDDRHYFKDAGIGCVWRSLHTAFSAITQLEPVPTKVLYDQFLTSPQLIAAYEKMKGVRLKKDEKKALAKLAPINHKGWAEPFIGKLYLAEHGIESREVKFGTNKPLNGVTPEFCHDKPSIADFKDLVANLTHHFNTQCCPVVIDDGSYSYAIVGLKKEGEQIALLIADPHTMDPAEAVYAVVLDKNGKQIGVRGGDKVHYPGSPKRIAFTKNNAWFCLFPEPIKN